jgi:hypothetical protein
MYARKHWRRIIVVPVVGAAFAVSLHAAWPVVFSTDSPPSFAPSAAAQESVATGLLRTVVGGGRTLYAPGKTFPALTPSALSSFSYNVPVVGAKTVARIGSVSMRLNGARTLTLATPADSQRCVFARDEPAKARTLFVTLRTTDCRASAAPTTGWRSR